MEQKANNQIKSHKFILPLVIYLPKKTKADLKIAVNWNILKGLHYTTYNDAKKLYAKEVNHLLEELIIKTPVNITYKVFKKTKGTLDKMNVLAAQSKFFLDAITKAGCWEDDSDEFVKFETLIPTELDRDNPRCEIIITEIDKGNA